VSRQAAAIPGGAASQRSRLGRKTGLRRHWRQRRLALRAMGRPGALLARSGILIRPAAAAGCPYPPGSTGLAGEGPICGGCGAACPPALAACGSIRAGAGPGRGVGGYEAWELPGRPWFGQTLRKCIPAGGMFRGRSSLQAILACCLCGPVLRWLWLRARPGAGWDGRLRSDGPGAAVPAVMCQAVAKGGDPGRASWTCLRLVAEASWAWNGFQRC